MGVGTEELKRRIRYWKGKIEENKCFEGVMEICEELLWYKERYGETYPGKDDESFNSWVEFWKLYWDTHLTPGVGMREEINAVLKDAREYAYPEKGPVKLVPERLHVRKVLQQLSILLEEMGY